MSKRCALLIDGNWLLMSRQCMARKQFLVENTQEQKQAGRAMTTDLMARSICLALNRLDAIVDDVIIVRDGKSWRKDVTKPASLHDEYKGTRKQDDNYDWKEIFGSLTDLENGMRSCGATVSQLRDAEGDDLIWWWSRKLNNEGENAIVWSSDNDLKQLVQFNGKAWTAWWNEKNGLFVDKALVNESVDDAIGFFLQDAYNTACIEEINRLSHAVKASPFAFDSASIIMEKIVCGDASDNIKSVVRTASKPIRKVSPKMWEALREELKIDTLDDFFKRKEEIVMAFMKQKRFAGIKMTFSDCIEQFDYNTRMVWLDRSQYPEELLKSMEGLVKEDFDVNTIKNNYRVMCGEDTGYIESVFNGIL